MTSDIFHLRKHFQVLSSFMTYHRLFNQIKATGATSGAGTAYSSEYLSSPLFLVGFVLLDLQFYVYVLSIVVCHFVLFLLAIVLSVLRYTDSDCPFGIFKLFLNTYYNVTIWILIYGILVISLGILYFRLVDDFKSMYRLFSKFQTT